MPFWFRFFLFIHIASVILAFGPTYTFPLIVAMGRKNPKNAPFAAQVTKAIEHRFTLPFAILTGIAGVGMVLVLHADFHTELLGYPWLNIAVILYLAALTFSLVYQNPNAIKMAQLMSTMETAGPPPEGAPAGPPPEVAALGKKLQFGGTVLGIAVLVIVILMVFQPGGPHFH